MTYLDPATDFEDDIPLEGWARDLLPQHALFVREFLVDLKASQAALRAGFTRSSAMSNGAKLLRKPKIMKAIAMAMAERAEALGITASTVLNEAFRCYLRSVEKGNMSAAARFLEMVGKHSDVGAFLQARGGLSQANGDDDDSEALKALSNEELQEFARLSRKIAGAGEASPPASQLN